MLSLGEELKREREFREISLREISDATKINMRMLEAIEKDNYQLLPGGIFNRNFIRAYAEFIGLDPEIAVRKYQVQTSSQVDVKLPPEAIPLLSIADSDVSRGLKKWILAVLLGAVVLAGVFYWLYRTNQIHNLFPVTPKTHVHTKQQHSAARSVRSSHP